MKVEVAVMGSPSLISLMVSVDVKQHCNENAMGIIMYPAFSRMPALKVTVGDSGLCPEIRSCVKVEVAVLGLPS